MQIQFVPRSKHSHSGYKADRLMLYRKLMAVYSEIGRPTEHTIALCGPNAELLNCGTYSNHQARAGDPLLPHFYTCFARPSPVYCEECVCVCIYRVSQEECARLREGVPYVKVYRYNPKHLCPKLNGYGVNGQRKVWSSGGSTHCTCQLTTLSMSVLECGVILRQFSSPAL